MASSDTHNFSSSSPRTFSRSLQVSLALTFPDRLPTLSASQALQDLSSTPRRPISTGLASLDSVLQGRGHDASSQDAIPGGISRGEVTEVYGPPGVGKTAIAYVMAFQASVHLLGQCFQKKTSS